MLWRSSIVSAPYTLPFNEEMMDNKKYIVPIMQNLAIGYFNRIWLHATILSGEFPYSVTSEIFWSTFNIKTNSKIPHAFINQVKIISSTNIPRDFHNLRFYD